MKQLLNSRMLKNILIVIFFLFALKTFSQVFTQKALMIDNDNKFLYVADNDVVVYKIEDPSVFATYHSDTHRADVLDLRNDHLLFGSKHSFTVVNINTGVSKTYSASPLSDNAKDLFLELNEDNSKIYVTWNDDISIQVIDANTGDVISKVGFSLPDMIITRMAISPDRKVIATSCRNAVKGGSYLLLWDTKTKALIKKTSLESAPYTMAFNHDGTQLLIGMSYQNFKSQSKYKINWNGFLKAYPLCLQVYSIPGGKLINEIPSENNNIYAACFDYDNPEIFYQYYMNGFISFDNTTRKFTKISSPGNSGCHLTSYKGHLAGTTGYKTTIYDAKDLTKSTDLYHYTIKPFYFSSAGNLLTGTDISKASLMFGMCYFNGAEHVQWLAVTKDGLYDCSGSFDNDFKWIGFSQFKPKTKEAKLLSRLSNSANYKALTDELAALLKKQEWKGHQVKDLFVYSELNFEPYEEMFGMKKKVEVANLLSAQLTGDVWVDACSAANVKMRNDGFNIVTEKSGNADGLTGSFSVNGTSTLRWYILGNSSSTKLEITTPKGSQQISLTQDGSKPLYFSSGEESTGSGNYSFRLIGGEKGYIIAGTKTHLSDQDNAVKMLEAQGYKVVFERTQYAKPHEPITAGLEIRGDISWIAFTDQKCAPLQVSVNGVSTGNSSTQNGMVINSGSTYIDKANGVEMKAVPISCGSSTTFIIGVK